MSCSNLKNAHMKSCARVYNNTPQTVTADLTSLILEGSPVVDSGCSICINTGSFSIRNSGLYHLSADVTIVPNASGVFTVQLYKDGIALPCALSRVNVATDSQMTVHVETDLYIHTCCVNTPVITLNTSGVAGSISHVCAGVLKLA